MSNAKLEEVPLEETIRKILQSELKLIFPTYFSQNSSAVMSEQIVAPIGPKIKSPNNIQSSSSDSTPDESSLEEEYIDHPMEIDFVQRKEPATDVVTVKCKIKRLVIPAGTVDPGANFPIMSEDISKRSKLEIDTKEKHDLRGIATTPTESLGIVRNVPVNFAPGCTIYTDFAVV